MMRRTGWIVVAACAALYLGGCEQTRELLGQTKKAPDEFAVYSRAPLSLPPEYALRPPAPGRQRPQESAPRASAESAMLGDRKTLQKQRAQLREQRALTAGTQALLRQTRALNSDPNVRSLVNKETFGLVEDEKTLTQRILFWKKKAPPGSVVDPMKESKRIRENLALGRPITTGETPTIERKKFAK
jgi:hypothetical protein